ncbi:F0F1 ATP synthase subunit alpha, partial [Mycoplasmopsis pullorum]
MANRIDDISAIIKDRIKNFESKVDYAEIGHVISIGDGIALASGLDKVKNSEIVIINENVYGLALNLEEEAVGIALFGNANSVSEGDTVKRTGKVISVNVGDQLLGRVVNSLGEAIDGKGVIKGRTREIFRVAPGVMSRKEVNQPLETGIIAIDSMIPI